VNPATSAKTGRSFLGSAVTLQTSAASPRPETSTTVGEPVPRQVIYILRPPPMLTRPEKSALGAEAAIVVSARPAVEFFVEPAHPAISSNAPSARARTLASIGCIEKILSRIKRNALP
jgi:hypothetical protein